MRTTRQKQTNKVAVQYAVPRRGVPGASTLRSWTRAVSSQPMTLRIVGRAEGRALNRKFRKKDYATNVLSFHSGDIVLCHPVIVREAREQKKSVRAHYAHLVVHGVLHLRGLEHGQGMEGREIRLLRRMGFGNPYAVESRRKA
jgi:probable rRNA maturation factor